MTFQFKYVYASLGIVYIWFGVLKFFPSLSPAEQLAKDTINLLTFGLIPSKIAIILLAIWEVVLGFALFFFQKHRFHWLTLRLLLLHLICTFLPLVFFPFTCFAQAPLVFTLVGQYIVKNIVFIAITYLLFAQEKQMQTAKS